MRSYTLEEFLQVWRKSMDSGYTVPLEQEAEGRGLDVIAGVAAVQRRLSLAVENSTQALYLRSHSTQTAPPASGGVAASGTVKVYRSNQMGVCTLKVGDRILVERLNINGQLIQAPEFQVATAIDLPGGSPGPFDVEVVASRVGYQGNVAAGTGGRFVELQGATFGGVDTTVAGDVTIHIDPTLGDVFTSEPRELVFRYLTGPNAGNWPRRYELVALNDNDDAVLDDGAGFVSSTGDTAEAVGLGLWFGLSVVFEAGLDNGRSPELDMLGGEVNLGRASGEGDEFYRQRISTLPDAVSPNAIIRGAASVLAPLGVDFDFVELFDRSVGFVFSDGVELLHAFDDPYGYRKHRFFVDRNSVAGAILGFLITINGEQLHTVAGGDYAEINRILGILVKLIESIRLPVPWVIAFEPAIPPPPEPAVTTYAAIRLFAAALHPGDFARGTGIESVAYDSGSFFWTIQTDDDAFPPTNDVVIAATILDNVSLCVSVTNASEPNEWNVFAYDPLTGNPVASPNITVTWSEMTDPVNFP